MKRTREEQDRWLKQAEHDLTVAKKHLADTFYADACYAAEQAAQKALKGYLYGQGERTVPAHAVQELLRLASRYHPAFQKLAERGRILDRYYIPTRYPDALAPPAVPFESFTVEDAREAIAIATEILTAVR